MAGKEIGEIKGRLDYLEGRVGLMLPEENEEIIDVDDL